MKRTTFESVDRSRLPLPGPARPLTFPSLEKSVLPNGLRLWTVRHAQVPLVALLLLIRRGAASDARGKEGLAAMTADMLDEGSGTLSAIDMHQKMARIGVQFDTDIGSDATVASMTVLSRFIEPALSLLSDVVARPALREEDFARVRQLRLHRLKQLRDMPATVADRAFLRLLYGEQPYGHSPIGSEAALASMTVDDVRGFHHTAIRPSDATLIAVGDTDHQEIARIAASAFSDWIGEAQAPPAEGGSRPERSPLTIVPRPAAPQSELRLGHVAVPRDTPDYHALVVGNTILGGQFVSRINLNLREDKGFTYGARTAFEFRRRPGPFVLQVGVQTAATVPAIEESIGELNAIRGPRPVTPEELSLATAALTRGYARNFETAEQISRGAMQLALYDLPDDYFAQFVPSIERVTCADVTRAMAAHLDPARLTTLVVGDLDAIGPELERLALGAPAVLGADSF
ncbi:MAG TPA: pitrilysin family protein [Vicinamibacterales bacterium]|nr:pitrilysin family protein [Vicinamibacterales bacterium]